jgi:choline dehydrogenase-like flavoprotein
MAAGPDRLNEGEKQVLRLLCDTLVPRLTVDPDPGGIFARSASDLGIVEEIARIVEEYLSQDQRADFRRLLRTVENSWLNLVLAGVPKRFSALTPEARERYLLGWAHSRLPVKRQGFHAIKRLTEFLFYSMAPLDGVNPNWSAIGYAPPDDAERKKWRQPEDLRIVPLHPEREMTLEADVCVVGSGAGGAVIAAKLAESGHRVIVLEAGAYRTADDFTQREADTYDRMFQGHGVLTTKDFAFGVLAGQTAGGSTTINWMTCLKPPMWARAEWEREAGMKGVASPEFDALLDEIQSRLHVTLEESVVNPNNDALRRGCEALGYASGTDYEVIPRNARGCEARCDFCFFGCVYSAKQSTLVTYLPDAYRAGARFLFDTTAETVVVEGGAARGVEAIYRGGATPVPVHVKSHIVVAAGSALQTPPLLWRSGIRFRGVGVGLRFDPTVAVLAEYPHPVRVWTGPPQTVVVTRFQDSDEGHHGPWIESAPGHPGLSALAIPWNGGRAHKDDMSRLARASATIVLARDVGEGVIRANGRGEPVIDYRLHPRDRSNLVRGLQEAARIHRAAGAVRIATLHMRPCSVGSGSRPIGDAEFEAFLERIRHLGIRENALALFTAHPMGSARAGLDPRTSAADPKGECHEVRDLWIGDGSLLPTAPGVNPMISIMGLAARTAAMIHERLTCPTP